MNYGMENFPRESAELAVKRRDGVAVRTEGQI